MMVSLTFFSCLVQEFEVAGSVLVVKVLTGVNKEWSSSKYSLDISGGFTIGFSISADEKDVAQWKIYRLPQNYETVMSRPMAET